MSDHEEAVWKRFVELVERKTFSEKELLTEGKRLRNFLGSVEAHKTLFDQAAAEILSKPR